MISSTNRAVDEPSPSPMQNVIGRTEIRIKGAPVTVRSAEVHGRLVIVEGKWLRVASIYDEDLVEGNAIENPQSFVKGLMTSDLKADLFTFRQKIPDTVPLYNELGPEYDSFAVIPITTYSEWLQNLAKSDVRSAINKSIKRGLVTRQAECDDQFIRGVVNIYNESPIRQGRPFWHYGKDFETVKQMTRTYIERSIFVASYLDDQLVGFIKMVKVGNVCCTLHVISMMKYSDKKPTNALIGKAVEICASHGFSHLVYGNFVYKDPSSSLTEFKKRNGFREMLIPRYYLPLTYRGRLALRTKLHHGVSARLPLGVWRALSNARAIAWKVRKKS